MDCGRSSWTNCNGHFINILVRVTYCVRFVTMYNDVVAFSSFQANLVSISNLKIEEGRRRKQKRELRAFCHFHYGWRALFNEDFIGRGSLIRSKSVPFLLDSSEDCSEYQT
jgi:hypothetical protein